MYDSAEQTKMRLGGTIVMYDGFPAVVNAVTPDNRLQLVGLPKGRDAFMCNVNDDKLNFQDFKLGYVNYSGVAGYLTRSPMRQQQQGISDRNIKMPKEFVEKNVRFNYLKLVPEFADALRGVYPTFEETIRRLEANGNIKSMAFARRFALYRDVELGYYELLYRGKKVAWGDPRQFNLPSEYTYMTELIQHEGVNIR